MGICSTRLPHSRPEVYLTCLFLLSSGRAANGQAEPPRIVRWSIEATVVDMRDPGKIFPEVRLGDPVRGTLTYDLNSFEHPSWFPMVTMAIDNPRTGGELRFEIDVEGLEGIAIWYDAFPDPNPPEGDSVFIFQSVLPPTGLAEGEPFVAVDLAGPPEAINGEHPLEDLTFEAWPFALLSFYDDFFGDTYIDAEIHSWKVVEDPITAGDFDYDGDVDGIDLFGWQDTFGAKDVLYADADGSGLVDGADFLIWQRNHAGAASFAATMVPEPATAMGWLALAWVVGSRAVFTHKRGDDRFR